MTREPENDIQAELAKLADGSLTGEERERLLSQVADSPELSAELELQRRALALMGALGDVEAPTPLRRSIEALAAGEGAPAGHPAARSPRAWRPGASRAWRPAGASRNWRPTGTAHARRPGRTRRQAGLALLAAGAAAVAVVLLLGGGSSPTAAPTLLQASSAGLSPATSPAPAESAHDGSHLEASAAGIPFPYWGALPPRPKGWRATGARTDLTAGRTVTTVFYADRAGRRIGYSIVSGAPLPVPAASTTVSRHGVAYHVARPHDPTVVTWRQAGHTCILTARGVSAQTLVHLAAWRRA